MFLSVSLVLWADTSVGNIKCFMVMSGVQPRRDLLPYANKLFRGKIGQSMRNTLCKYIEGVPDQYGNCVGDTAIFSKWKRV